MNQRASYITFHSRHAPRYPPPSPAIHSPWQPPHPILWGPQSLLKVKDVNSVIFGTIKTPLKATMTYYTIKRAQTNLHCHNKHESTPESTDDLHLCVIEAQISC
ncbi:hypothetical protein E2C01_062808 [Portunus trituberculatus]|uniref:Uncharacterized protein n=1 Tax=Portunus trituberculatus TaxID=210409 RepID=A0A5B7HF29_PORTR|nr:hypothetical protein [Portunus trituberculatus]